MARLQTFPRAARRETASPGGQPVWLRRIRERGLSQMPLAIPVLLALVGAGAAAAMLAIDAAVSPHGVPAVPQLGEENARSVLSALAGALLTVVVLVFWVRMVAVQMASNMFSASILQSFLHDRFQQMTMGLVIGALTYTLVVAQAIPDGGAGMVDVPHLSVAVALVAAVVVAVLVVVSVSHGARDSRTGSLLRRVSDNVVAQVRATHPERGTVHGSTSGELASPDPPNRPCYLVLAGASGWIQRLEEDRLLDALPAHAVAQLEVRVGHFLTEGTPLCRVWLGNGDAHRAPQPGHDLDAAVDERVRSAVTLGDGPTLEQDVPYGLKVLSDVAERALAPTSGDSSAAELAIMRLGVVLREVLVRDLPAPTREDHQSRVLLRPHELAPSDFMHRAFDRVRQAGSSSPTVAMALLNTMAMLRDVLEEIERGDWVGPLRQQAVMTVEGARRSTMLAGDFAEVARLAERRELISADEVMASI